MKKPRRLAAGGKVSLKKIPTRIACLYESDEDYKSQLARSGKKLHDLQEKLYAEHERGVLIIFQGMDTAGKDGSISHVMAGLNPQGCWVASFKVPNSVELSHDFLWRVIQNLPSRGKIGIFNRSYYEDLIVPRVHPNILKTEKLPKNALKQKHFWRHRYDDVVQFEQYLLRQGYEIIKIFLHISKAEQKVRLIERFKDPSKLWKISASDIRERSYWDDYQRAYAECFERTAYREAPWYVVPADDKKNARIMISELILERLKKMNPKTPVLSGEDRRKLLKLRKLLV